MNDHFLNPANGECPTQRRAFILDVLKAAGASALMAIPGTMLASGAGKPLKKNDREGIEEALKEDLTRGAKGSDKTYTVQDILDIILKEIPGAPFHKTVDTLKSGDKDQPVTGIVTTMFATVPVIREAIRRKANFIIAHEPTFYNHLDELDWVKENNDTLQEKQALLKERQIAVWRFHDYWHAHIPDGVLYGVVKKIGWEKYFTGEGLLAVPEISLKDMVLQIKDRLKIKQVRVIGNLSQSCRRVLLMPGASGGQAQIAGALKHRPDVLIVGELNEWETAEYVRDSIALGKKIALVALGHAVSEEPGMEWLKEWLQPKIPGMSITHIPATDPFTAV